MKQFNQKQIQSHSKEHTENFSRKSAVACSAVIVAGGLNSRMGGKNKAFLQLGGKTILQRLLDTLQGQFDEILLVTKNPAEYSSYDVKTVTDRYDDRSSLTGIHSGIYNAKNEFSFIVPCDAPFIQPSMVKLLLDSIEPEYDIIIPYYDDHYEPLCAIYSKRCIPQIEILLKSADYRIYNFFHAVNLKNIDKARLKAADSRLISFFNVNTPETLETAIKMASMLSGE